MFDQLILTPTLGKSATIFFFSLSTDKVLFWVIGISIFGLFNEFVGDDHFLNWFLIISSAFTFCGLKCDWKLLFYTWFVIVVKKKKISNIFDLTSTFHQR